MLKKFITNTFWLTIGKFGTSLIAFLLVPLYTRFLNPAEFGFVDLLVVTIVFFVPIITCQTGDAIQTFILKKDKDVKVVFTNSIIVFISVWLFSWIFYPLVIKVFKQSTLLIYFLILLQGASNLLFYLNKGMDRLKNTTIASVIESIFLLILMFYTLSFLKLGIKGYLLSLFLSKIILFSVYFVISPLWRYFSLSAFSVKEVKIILIFSLPLIPNMIGWWINNVSDRYMISYFLGMESNGIYAIGTKIPSILSVFATILISSWHITALQNYEKKQGVFFKSLGYTFSFSFLIVALLIILFRNMIFHVYVSSDNYIGALDVLILLTLGAVLSAISSFFGVVYLGEKQTKYAAYTTAIGGVLNLGLNFLLIPSFGIIGAASSTFASFLVVAVLRYIYVVKRTSIRIHYSVIISILIVLTTTVFTSLKLVSTFISNSIVVFILLWVLVIMLKEISFKQILKQL